MIVAVIIPIVIMAAEFERAAWGHGERQSIVNSAGGREMTRRAALLLLALLFACPLEGGQSTIVCRVTTKGEPVTGVEVAAAGKTYVTDQRGEARIEVEPGSIELTVLEEGFAPVTTRLSRLPPAGATGHHELEKLPSVQETVTVSATRTDRGLEDQPMRVEVLDAEEIEEKMMMTPGDIVMMLNEMGGMRVQATSPSLGAASVRIQGMRGRYTRFLRTVCRCSASRCRSA